MARKKVEETEETTSEGEETNPEEETEPATDEEQEESTDKGEDTPEQDSSSDEEQRSQEVSEPSDEGEDTPEQDSSSDEEKEQFDIEDIPGVGATTARKMREAGYQDAMGIATSSPVGLAEVCEIGESTARKIIDAARAHLKMDFITGSQVLERMKTVKRISTSSNSLNSLIGGGIETQAISEAYGAFGSGKSQLAFQLAINVQLPEDQGGVEGEAVWVDTEGTFRPSRIIQLAEAKGLNKEDVLKKIHVARAYSADHQVLLIEKIPELMKNNPNIKLVIVDSLTSIFRSEYVGRGTLAERQQKLNKHIHDLQRLADRYNLAVYVTNQVMAKPDMFFGDPTAAVGGHVLAHASSIRLYLRHSKGNKRVAKLVDSSFLPEGEAAFSVDEKGLGDIE